MRSNGGVNPSIYVASLSVVIQGNNDTVRDYIELFTREAKELKGANVKYKCFIFKKGLWMDTMFKERLGLKELQNMSELLTRDRPNFWLTM
jgi:hypothetical protein